MKKLIIVIIMMFITVVGFLATMHICYSKENGVSIFPKESISFAYSIVNIDSLRTDARNDGLIITTHIKPVIYILSNM